jgi:hypothetical protein
MLFRAKRALDGLGGHLFNCLPGITHVTPVLDFVLAIEETSIKIRDLPGRGVRLLERKKNARRIDVCVSRVKISLTNAHLKADLSRDFDMSLPKRLISSIDHVISIHEYVIETIVMGPPILVPPGDRKVHADVSKTKDWEGENGAHQLAVLLNAFELNRPTTTPNRVVEGVRA